MGSLKKILTICTLVFMLTFTLTSLVQSSSVRMSLKAWLSQLPTVGTLYTSTSTYLSKTLLVFTTTTITDSTNGLTISKPITITGEVSYSSGTANATTVKLWGMCASSPTAIAIGDMFISTVGKLYIAESTGTGSWTIVGGQS